MTDERLVLWDPVQGGTGVLVDALPVRVVVGSSGALEGEGGAHHGLLLLALGDAIGLVTSVWSVL